ncbi:MAG: DUF488 domain-containing protein [Dehalococcoidia bacterium]
MSDAVELWTVGHSTRTFDEFVSMLTAWRIETLVDVRTVPRSRRHPHFNSDALAAALPERSIAYVHLPELGGFRKPRADSANMAWQNESFRGYADYMLTADFAAALERLIALAGASRAAIMCAEAVPWRCHRSLIADALTARGHSVDHIMSASNADTHRMTRFARIEHGRVTYPAML